MKNSISIHGDVKHGTSSPPARAREGEVKWSPRSEQLSWEGIDKSRITIWGGQSVFRELK